MFWDAAPVSESNSQICWSDFRRCLSLHFLLISESTSRIGSIFRVPEWFTYLYCSSIYVRSFGKFVSWHFLLWQVQLSPGKLFPYYDHLCHNWMCVDWITFHNLHNFFLTWLFLVPTLNTFFSSMSSDFFPLLSLERFVLVPPATDSFRWKDRTNWPVHSNVDY